MSVFLHLLYVYQSSPHLAYAAIQGKNFKCLVFHTHCSKPLLSLCKPVCLINLIESFAPDKKLIQKRKTASAGSKILTDLLVSTFSFGSQRTSKVRINFSKFAFTLCTASNEYSTVSRKAFSLLYLQSAAFPINESFQNDEKKEYIFFCFPKISHMKKNFQNSELFKGLEDDLHKVQIRIWINFLIFFFNRNIAVGNSCHYSLSMSLTMREVYVPSFPTQLCCDFHVRSTAVLPEMGKKLKTKSFLSNLPASIWTSLSPSHLIMVWHITLLYYHLERTKDWKPEQRQKLTWIIPHTPLNLMQKQIQVTECVHQFGLL